MTDADEWSATRFADFEIILYPLPGFRSVAPLATGRCPSGASRSESSDLKYIAMKFTSILSWYGRPIHLILLLALICVPHAGRAQAFSVSPMQLQLNTHPGHILNQEITVTSMRTEGLAHIQLSTMMISENSQGVPVELDRKDASQINAAARLRSCVDWITLDSSEMVITPRQQKEVPVHIKIPQSARGYYYAAIIISEMKAGSGKYAISLEFRSLVLILLTVQGPTAKQKIALTGVAMQYKPLTIDHPATTDLILSVDNQGETFAHIMARASISYLAVDKWRRLTQMQTKAVGILPGVTMNPAEDMRRKLPAGRYKINGQLLLDNRPAGFIDQFIDYAGDPTVTKVLADVNMSIDPATAQLSAQTGSVRSLVLTAHNLSDEPIEVEGSLLSPDELRAKTPVDRDGEQFDATKWLTLATNHVILRAQGRTGLRIISNIPADAILPPYLYSQLRLRWKFPTGENAGEMTIPITINIHDSKMVNVLNAEVQQIDLVHQTDNIYAVITRFLNTGNMDFLPIATAEVTLSDSKQQASITRSLETSTLRVLPRGSALFSGELDFSTVKPGIYALIVAMSYGAKDDAMAQLSLRVQTKDGKQIVTVIEQPETTSKATDEFAKP
jgi:hypothetical protein